MYTVLRFHSSDSPVLLEQFGTELNKIRPGSFQRFDKIGDRFSIDASTASNFDEHVNAVTAIITQIESVMHGPFGQGISVKVDTAVEPEDYLGRRLTLLDGRCDYLAALSRVGASLLVSVYGSGCE